MTKKEKMLWLAQTWILSRQVEAHVNVGAQQVLPEDTVRFLCPLLSVRDGAIPRDLLFALEQYVHWMVGNDGRPESKPSWWLVEDGS